MYLRPAFVQTDLAAIRALMQHNAFADPAQFDVMALAPGDREHMFPGIRGFRIKPMRVEGSGR